MTECETSFFRLVDQYARILHDSFLAEFFPAREDVSSYYLCFRPLTGNKHIPGSCKLCTGKYITVAAFRVMTDGTARRLSDELIQLLDRELT